MISELPAPKKALLDDIVRALQPVKGVAALALGGSHARGTHRPDSDLDIGLYYREGEPFAIDEIGRIARRFCGSDGPTVTGFYEWGPFVNGGAWIGNAVCKIDFLYRNLDQLERTVADAQRGKTEHSFDQHPPFGFRTVTTLGEIDCCQPLFDPAGVLASLKARVATYPPLLRAHIIQSSLWAAEFSFIFADGFARDGDVPNAVACLTRIYHYLVQALFALNETYFINDKRVAPVMDGFKLLPAGFHSRVSVVLGKAGSTRSELDASIAAFRTLWRETVDLEGGSYRPKFAL